MKGDKFILAKNLQVKIVKVFSDETIEIKFQGNTGIFLKKDFIFIKENVEKNNESNYHNKTNSNLRINPYQNQNKLKDKDGKGTI